MEPIGLLVVVTGSRLKWWTDPQAVEEDVQRVLDELCPRGLMEGGADGVDRWAGRWGERNLGRPFWVTVRADWDTWHRGAGMKRNREMLLRARKAQARGWTVEVHAWWDGQSPGTGGMIREAEQRKLEVVVHRSRAW